MTDLQKAIKNSDKAFNELLKSIDKVDNDEVKKNIYNKLIELIKADDVINKLTRFN